MYKIGLAILLSGLMTINFPSTPSEKYNKMYEDIYTAIINLEDSANLFKYGFEKVKDGPNIIKKSIR